MSQHHPFDILFSFSSHHHHHPSAIACHHKYVIYGQSMRAYVKSIRNHCFGCWESSYSFTFETNHKIYHFPDSIYGFSSLLMEDAMQFCIVGYGGLFCLVVMGCSAGCFVKVFHVVSGISTLDFCLIFTRYGYFAVIDAIIRTWCQLFLAARRTLLEPTANFFNSRPSGYLFLVFPDPAGNFSLLNIELSKSH